MTHLNSLKKDFPIFEGSDLIYLDTAATAQKPISVIQAIDDFYRTSYGTVHRAIYDLSIFATKHYEAVREKVARFINAPHLEEIIFTRGTTEAINLVASSFGKAFIKPGDEVLISEVEHHANIVPWQMCALERGAKLVVCPVTDKGEIDLGEFEKRLSSKTKIVAVAHVSNVLGTIHPIKQLIEMAHQKRAYVLIDGAQSAPHMAVDVLDLNADFFVFSGHKMYGPTGIGVLYGKKELLEKMPPYQGGGDMIDSVTFEKTIYQPSPLKFEAGTPMIAEVIGLGAALDYIASIGMETIATCENSLHQKLEKGLRAISGLTIIGTALNKAAITSFVLDGIHALDIGTLLNVRKIAVRTGHQCSQPTHKRFGIGATTRVSFGIYNQERDVDTFLEVLQEIIRLLRS